jgi:hypothetical protein
MLVNEVLSRHLGDHKAGPGEQLTIQVFEDFLRKVWRDKIGVPQAQPGESGAGADRT